MLDTVESKTHTWQEAWWKALAHPSVKMFEDLSNDPTVNGNRAYKWIFMGGLISSLSASICAPFIAIIAVVCTAIYVFIISLIARFLKGTGTYKQLFFVMAAYSVPLGIISGWLELSDSTSPFLGYASLLLFFYGLLLSVIAVKAVHQFSWLKALAANFFLPVIFISALVLMLFVSNYAAVNVGINFMSALKNRNDTQAYNLCTPELQTELGSPQNMKMILDEGGGQVTDWAWWISSYVEGNGARISGYATFATGQTDTLDLFLIYTDGVWKINGYNWQGDEELPIIQE